MFSKETNSLKASIFNQEYFRLHDYIYREGDDVSSRNGHTKEVLNFKTELTDPGRRCIGGYGRDINIFFLLAEAMWIFKGRRDLAFLEIFNAGMKGFSDDGKYFYAPYGWRLRKYGMNSMTWPEGEEGNDFDQLKIALNALHSNPSDRRIVLAIWNPTLDLAVNSRDIPCNDLLMFKVRNGKLHQTIANRSNDLNWGLTTNVFQFSFLGEVMSSILGIEYGTQTHLSQSLHLYMNDDNHMSQLTSQLQAEIIHAGDYDGFRAGQHRWKDIYNFVIPLRLDFNFKTTDDTVDKKLFWADFYMYSIIVKLLNMQNGNYSLREDEMLFEAGLEEFSFGLWYIYQLLKVYLQYKKTKDLEQAIANLVSIYKDQDTSKYDVSVLALNFFMARLQRKDKARYIETFDWVCSLFPRYKELQIGRL